MANDRTTDPSAEGARLLDEALRQYGTLRSYSDTVTVITEDGPRVATIVERHKIRTLFAGNDERFSKRCVRRIAAPLLIASGAREVHQYAAHQLGGYSEEMCAAFPLHPVYVHKPQISLVDKRCRLQHVTGSLPTHIEPGKATKLVVHERHQLV